MYLQTGEELGQVEVGQKKPIVLRPVTVTTKPSRETSITRELKVRFRHRYEDFQREVQGAIGRWTTYRSDRGVRARQLIEQFGDLRTIHNAYLKDNIPDGTQVTLSAIFRYVVGQSGRRRVNEIRFQLKDHGNAPTAPKPPVITAPSRPQSAYEHCAEKLMDMGRKLFATQEYDCAIILFERVGCLSGISDAMRAKAWFNSGFTHRRLGHFVTAIIHFEHCLSTPGISPGLRAKAQEQLKLAKRGAGISTK